MLELHGVAASYGPVRALQGVDLTVAEGAVAALLGANGAGKSSTMRAVAGLLPLSAGEIRYAGERLDGLPADERVRRGVSYVPEGRGVFASMSVAENLRLGAYVRRDRANVERDLRRMTELFPVLGHRAAQTAGLLSGGEQQMLAIARALMSAPRLLLLDEPSLGLAPRVQLEIFTRIDEISGGGVTVLLAEQNANLALGVASEGHLIAGGRVQLSAPATELRRSDAVRRSYLGD